MNELIIFNNPDFGEVRTIEIDGDAWFVLRDVCDALEISKTAEVASRLDNDEVDLTDVVDSRGQKQNTYIVNESGLYNVIMRSDKPKAKDFKRWITHDVLPSIRKTGGYQLPQVSQTQLIAMIADKLRLRLKIS